MPTHPPDKKLSKNEILRMSIKYIRLLTNILDWQTNQEPQSSENLERNNNLTKADSECRRRDMALKPSVALECNARLLMIVPQSQSNIYGTFKSEVRTTNELKNCKKAIEPTASSNEKLIFKKQKVLPVRIGNSSPLDSSTNTTVANLSNLNFEKKSFIKSNGKFWKSNSESVKRKTSIARECVFDEKRKKID